MEPIMPPRLLSHRTPLAAALVPTLTLYLNLHKSNWFSCMCAFSVIYNLPLFYQVVMNLSAAESGVRLIPNSIGASLGSLGYGMLMAKTVCSLQLATYLTIGALLLAWDDCLYIPIHWYGIIVHVRYDYSLLETLYFRRSCGDWLWRDYHGVTHRVDILRSSQRY
jgi:hypothetical protein